MKRRAEIKRETKETTISVSWKVDGTGEYTISTGIPFFDHMLELFTRHGFFDVTVKAKGDVDVDFHHTVEDVGLAMGKALKESLPGFTGIRRYGSAIVPMDESLCMCAVDLCGRPSFVWKGKARGKIGVFDVETLREFFKGLTNEAGIALHINILYGENLHHRVEAAFKAFGRALREAATRDERVVGALSTKGVL